MEKLFTEYCRKLRAENRAFNTDIATHVSTKLEQLKYIYLKIAALEESNNTRLRKIVKRLDAGKKPFKGSTSGLPKSSFELQLYAEVFYYVAWRLIKMLNVHIPGFRSFECAEIRLVRNNLLEHPEKGGHIYVNTFISGGKSGPSIKGVRPEYQAKVFVDKGFYYNVGEFLEKMKTKLLLEIKRAESV